MRCGPIRASIDAMTTTASTNDRLPIGTFDGVEFDVVAWGPAHADVDISVACMFEHELGAGMTGGLLALDDALGGQLARLRAAGAFRAQAMETLLVTTPPPGWSVVTMRDCFPLPAVEGRAMIGTPPFERAAPRMKSICPPMPE